MRVQNLLLFSLLWICSHAQEAKRVQASLNAKWSSTSLLAEASEFFSKESNESFWRFVQQVNSKSKDLNWESLTEEQKYDFTIKQSAQILSSGSLDLLKFSLALRVHSPAVQLYQQIGTEQENVNCDAFFVSHGTKGCTIKELNSFIAKVDGEAETLLSVDHVFPNEATKATVVIYGELGSQSLSALLTPALALAKKSEIRLALRHFTRKLSENQVSLSGYAVELAIKNTEYKAVDESKTEEETPKEENLHGFNFQLLEQLHPEVKDSLEAFRMHLKEVDELAPLKNWQLQDLGIQAALKVAESGPDSIDVLKDVAQNFPLHARPLTRINVPKSFRLELQDNQKALSDADVEVGDNIFLLNGINADIDSLDLFQLVEILKQEDKLVAGFHNLGLKENLLSVLSGMELSTEKTSYAVDTREANPFFINNLDTDKKYKDWGNSVKLMLQPYYPGMIRPIARNFFTIVFVLDPTEPKSRDFLKTIVNFYRHDIAMRFGVVLDVNPDREVTAANDFGVAVYNLFNYVVKEHSVEEAILVLTDLLSPATGILNRKDPSDVINFFKKKYYEADYEDVFSIESSYDNGRAAGREFLLKSGIQSSPAVLLNGVLLDRDGLGKDSLDETIMMEVMKCTPKIQRAIMEGRLKDRTNVANWLMDQKDVMPRINNRILDAPSLKNYLNLFGADVESCKKFKTLSKEDKARCIIKKTKYIQKSVDGDVTSPVTLWISSDVDTPEGRAFAYNAVQLLKSASKSRIGLILNPEHLKKACYKDSVSSYVYAATRLLPNNQARMLIPKLLKEEYAAGLEAKSVKFEDVAISGMNVENFLKEKALLGCEGIEEDSQFAYDVIGLKPGARAVVANGLVVGPLNTGEELTIDDFKLLEKLMLNRGANVIAANVEKWGVSKTNGKASDVVLSLASLIGTHATAKKRKVIKLKSEVESVVVLEADEPERAAMDIFVAVDPLSPTAQKLAPILDLIRKVINVNIKIALNPKSKLSELPIRRFYRYVVASQLTFTSNGQIAPNLALFTDLPRKQLLTMSVHAPDSWMVEAVVAKYDLDNIKLEQATEDVVAIFSLEHILLEGQCFEEGNGQPPRGLQFVLGIESKPAQYDTIVMANLGYFQLKANPGSWRLQLREGRSKEIYEIVSQTFTEEETGQIAKVVIDSFTGKSVRIRVAKQRGMEEENLLGDDESIWSNLGSFMSDDKPEKINVFSLASGHLYERFMRIMFLSVLKNTRKQVKFWLLKNYLSPQFKQSLPILAKHYGFEYELIEYKWPRWLHQQKEKHRIMWGYKILFLDVLFPLDVQKVIFVDADQVVRADLMELMNFDLGGAPYGYVPFCDSRKEMDGFRFWKQGYWANHLAGRRYHISALYVIDLQKFRRVAAGDRLRGQYQGLSSDPNSLSNLDQDLPNNMVHQVKIKSLPQEWLWCETWCDDGSKKNAKTIDLCNNPLTKEPKLDSAVRIIGEWQEYDDEIKKVISGEAVHEKTVEKHSEL